MKSLGDTLKTAREERGISMDQVVHETNISRNYLEALENEDFDEFPAEAYLIGFLRNYSDFLGLDSDKIVGQFKNYKLSEEPTPLQELVGRPKGSVIKKIGPWVLIAVVLAAAGVLGIPRLISVAGNFKEERARKAEEAQEPAEIREIVPPPAALGRRDSPDGYSRSRGPRRNSPSVGLRRRRLAGVFRYRWTYLVHDFG